MHFIGVGASPCACPKKRVATGGYPLLHSKFLYISNYQQCDKTELGLNDYFKNKSIENIIFYHKLLL